jgi:hypothetical protein
MINQQEMIQSAHTFIVPNTALDYWRREDPVGKKKLWKKWHGEWSWGVCQRIKRSIMVEIRMTPQVRVKVEVHKICSKIMSSNKEKNNHSSIPWTKPNFVPVSDLIKWEAIVTG